MLCVFEWLLEVGLISTIQLVQAEMNIFFSSILYLKRVVFPSTVPTCSSDLTRSFYIGNKLDVLCLGQQHGPLN